MTTGCRCGPRTACLIDLEEFRCRCRCCDVVECGQDDDSDHGFPSVPGQSGSRWDEERIANAQRENNLGSQISTKYYNDLNFDNLQTNDKAQDMLMQQAVRTFVRTLLSGIVLEVVTDDGNAILTDCELDTEAQAILLSVQDIRRSIPIHHIEAVLGSDELNQWGIVTTNDIFLDKNCATLVIKDGQFLTFKFDTVRMREYFQVCLHSFIVSRQSPGKPKVDQNENDPSSSYC